MMKRVHGENLAYALLSVDVATDSGLRFSIPDGLPIFSALRWTLDLPAGQMYAGRREEIRGEVIYIAAWISSDKKSIFVVSQIPGRRTTDGTELKFDTVSEAWTWVRSSNSERILESGHAPPELVAIVPEIAQH